MTQLEPNVIRVLPSQHTLYGREITMNPKHLLTLVHVLLFAAMTLAACNTVPAALSTDTVVPSSATPIPPTATPVPPTNTPVPPTLTRIPPTPTLTVTPMPQPGDVLLAEDFSNGLSVDWWNSTGNMADMLSSGQQKYYVNEEALIVEFKSDNDWMPISVLPPNLFLLSDPDEATWPADVDVNFKAILKEGHLAGVLCREKDLENFYMFTVSGSQRFVILKVVDGQRAVPLYGPTVSQAIQTGENEIRAVCAGNQLQLFVNGAELATVRDNALTEGNLMLQAQAEQTRNVKVVIDDLSIKVPEPPVYIPGELLFEAQTDPETWSLFTMKANGSERNQLTDSTISLGAATWSPDGQQIVAGSGQIFVIDADGSNLKPLTEADASIINGYPTWSPDGTRIAFVSNRTGKPLIYVMEPDGLNQIPFARALIGMYPAWAPDGFYISFWAKDSQGIFQAYVADEDNFVRQLTNNSADDAKFIDGRTLAWSPNGQQVAFVSARSGTPEIYIMDEDGTNISQLTRRPPDDVSDGFVGFPAWSPDGEWIAFASTRGNPDNITSLYVIQPDGSNLIKLMNGLAQAQESCPTWRPGQP